MGQLQLNAFEPIIAHSLFESCKHPRRGIETLTERCVKGISANRERLRAMNQNRRRDRQCRRVDELEITSADGVKRKLALQNRFHTR